VYIEKINILNVLNKVVDIFLLNVSVVLCLFIHYKNDWFAIYQQNFHLLLIFNALWVLLAYVFFKLYDDFVYVDSIIVYRNILKILMIQFVCSEVIFQLLLIKGKASDIWPYIYLPIGSTAIFALLSIVERIILFSTRKYLRNKGLQYRKNTIIVGDGYFSLDLMNNLEKDELYGYHVLGFFDNNPNGHAEHALYKGKAEDAVTFAKMNNVDEIFCSLTSFDNEQVKHNLMLESDRNLIRLRLVPNHYNIFNGKNGKMEMVTNIPVISLRQEPLEYKFNYWAKRIFDVALSLFMIVFVCSWLFPILAVLIKVSSRGPVFFVQGRSGRNNKPFKCIKFRSMYVNTEADKQQTTVNDKRITMIGAFMRKTSIDELPQFFNVLYGNMSVVGPRPHMLKHTKEYSQQIDKFMVRHLISPGITGWAQVRGLRGEIKSVKDIRNRVEADVWYMENWSFLLDMKIIFLTIWIILKGDENAY
jgi:Undecaprenyl-phosphate glucose phosphotransferase